MRRGTPHGIALAAPPPFGPGLRPLGGQRPRLLPGSTPHASSRTDAARSWSPINRIGLVGIQREQATEWESERFPTFFVGVRYNSLRRQGILHNSVQSMPDAIVPMMMTPRHGGNMLSFTRLEERSNRSLFPTPVLYPCVVSRFITCSSRGVLCDSCYRPSGRSAVSNLPGKGPPGRLGRRLRSPNSPDSTGDGRVAQSDAGR